MSFDAPQTLHEEFAAALRRRDVEALVAMYEAGAVQLQGDGSVSSSTDGLRAVFEGLVSGPAMPDVDQRLAIVADDVALTSTAYVFDAAGTVTTMTTAEVSRRQPDGTWLVVIDAPSFLVQRGREHG